MQKHYRWPVGCRNQINWEAQFVSLFAGAESTYNFPNNIKPVYCHVGGSVIQSHCPLFWQFCEILAFERWHADASHGARHHLWVGAGHHPWGVADTASGTGGVAVWVGHCQGKACPPLDLRHLLNSRNLVRLGSLRVRAVDFGPDDPTQCCHRRFVAASNFADDSFHSSLLGTCSCLNLLCLLRRVTMSSGSVAPTPCARFLD